MNPLKLSIAVAVAGLFASTGTVAAQAYTYLFDAAPGQSTALDGSTITIQGGAITSWDLRDTDLGAELTPADSSTVIFEKINSYGAATWDGSFEIGYFTITLEPTIGYFTSNIKPIIQYQYSFQGDNSAAGGDLNFGLLDPPGTWTQVGSVPDALNSLQLLALALAALAASQLYFRRPVPVLARK